MSGDTGHNPLGMCAVETTSSFALSEGGKDWAPESGSKLTGPPGDAPLTFDAVYSAHFGFVWRAVRGLGVRPPHVDDAAQEVFLVVHRRLSTLEDPHAIKAWLWGIARRVAKDHRRAAGRRGTSVEIDPERTVHSGRDPERLNAERQAMEIVSAYAETLDDERRELFFLALVEGMPVSDVAELLGSNVNTTYSRVRAIRRELTDLLGASGAKGESHGSA
jgi:RNA polymerase sigma-70 factor, ECF subfamily